KGHKLLFADLPIVTRKVVPKVERTPPGTNWWERERRFTPPPGVEVVSKKPLADAERLLREFISHAYRRPAAEPELKRFLRVTNQALKKGNNFTDAMVATYTAVLCSPEFICLEQK